MAETPVIEVQWSSRATDDALAIVEFIADDNPRAAEALVDLIEQGVGQLAIMPNRGRVGRVTGTRELVLTPNYIAVYRHEAGRVLVLRVLHSMQQWPRT